MLSHPRSRRERESVEERPQRALESTEASPAYTGPRWLQHGRGLSSEFVQGLVTGHDGQNGPPTRSCALNMRTPEKEVTHFDFEAYLADFAITPPKGVPAYRRRASSGAYQEIARQAESLHSTRSLKDYQAEVDRHVHPERTVARTLALQAQTHSWRHVSEVQAGKVGKAAQSEEKLQEFSIRSPGFCAAAASQSWEDLPLQLQNALEFLRKLPYYPQTLLRNARPFLPPPTKPTLVLDLDETLVHCCRGLTQMATLPDMIVEFDDGISTGRVHFRPFVQIFLEVVSRTFEVVVFTASQQSYADQVIDALDPARALISHRLYRQHCTEFRGAYFKELGLLGRPLSQCVLVDNSPISVACNAQNGVLIRSWYGDLQDQELLALLEVLEDMQKCSAQGGYDRYLSRRYGLHDFFQALLDLSDA